MIDADHITFNDDGTAWLLAPPADHAGGWIHLCDRPCDTCDGRGRACLNGHTHDNECPWTIPCPDCIDGRHTFTIEVKTNHPNECSGCGRLRTAWNSDCHCGYSYDGPPACGSRNHRVSVVPGMVLPIDSFVEHETGSVPQWIALDTPGASGVHLWNGRTWVTLDSFPPAARLGMWAVKVAG